MEQLLSLLKTIPEYAAMVSSLQDGESVAVTGIGQINRSHMIAGLCRTLNRPMVVLSTASPYKFPRSVLEALGHTAPENDFEAMQALEEATGRTAPASLAALRQKAERFSTVIDPAQIAEVALGCQA